MNFLNIIHNATLSLVETDIGIFKIFTSLDPKADSKIVQMLVGTVIFLFLNYLFKSVFSFYRLDHKASIQSLA